MKFRAVLHGVDGLDRPKQIFGNSQGALETWATQILDSLTDEQRKKAYVNIEEQRWEIVREYAR